MIAFYKTKSSLMDLKKTLINKMPSIAQTMSYCITCKGQVSPDRLPSGDPSTNFKGSIKRSSKKALWVRFVEDTVSATEEAISDLVKVLNPTLHDTLLKSNETVAHKNPLRDHKGDLPINLIQTSIQTAVQEAVQSAIQEALRDPCSTCKKDFIEPIKEEEEGVA